MSSNIRQKKCKVRNLYEIVLDFSLFNSGLILANNFFESISFANNENNQKNSTFGTIYKSNNQTAENRVNIECKLIRKELQGIIRRWLTSKKQKIRKQAKLAKKQAAKLEAIEKKRLKKEIKKIKTLVIKT